MIAAIGNALLKFDPRYLQLLFINFISFIFLELFAILDTATIFLPF